MRKKGKGSAPTMSRKKHKKQRRQARGAFQPLPRESKEQKAKVVQQRYEAGLLSHLHSPEYLADKAKRDAEYAEIQERRRIEKMMKGSENTPEMSDELRKLFDLG